MEEWKTYKIGEISEVNKSQYSPKDNWQNFLYLDTGSITRNQIDSIQTISLATELPSRARRKVVNFDIVYSTVRPNQCHYGILKNPKTNLLVSTGFAVITVNQEVANPLFVYYYLTQDYIIDALQAIAEQSVSAYPSIKPSDIENVEVYLPPLNIQNTIANILSSLDSKIELNNRINHNLEEQAQALYKSWFVDFEPFKDGKFVESELGMIPEGWRVVSLGEIASISKRTITPSKHPDTVFKHYSIPAYDSMEMPENQKGADILSNKFILEGNSVLFSKLNPRIRRIWVVNGDVTNSICSTEFVIYLSKIKDEYPFLCSIVESDKFYADIMSKVNGATGSHQRFHPEESLEFRIPYNPNTVEHFSRLITPIREMKDILKRESAQLTIERDTLLPRLMSGELKINEIDC